MKNKWIAALALAGLLLTTGAYAESTPSETAAPVQAQAAAEPQHQLKVTTKYRYFISQYRYIRERKVSYFDNVYAYNHGEYSLTPFDSTVPEEYFVTDEGGTLAIAPIVLDITDAMRERLYGADVGETALYYGQYCERKKDRKGVWGYTGIHEGIDFVNVKGAPLYAILGGEVTRGADKNGTVAIYNAEYDVTLLYLHCENSIVRRGDTVEAGDMIAKEGKTNISGGANTHYTHVELRKGRHTSSSPYRDIVLTSDCPYAVMQQALGVVESGRQPITAAAVTQVPRKMAGCRCSRSSRPRMLPLRRMLCLRRRANRSRRPAPIRGILPQANSSSWARRFSDSGNSRRFFWWARLRRRCQPSRRGAMTWRFTAVWMSRSSQSGFSRMYQAQSFRFCRQSCQMLRRSSGVMLTSLTSLCIRSCFIIRLPQKVTNSLQKYMIHGFPPSVKGFHGN